jgi:chitodextrinase
MGNHKRRYLGRILLDAGFLSNNDLDQAFVEQKQTGGLLGQVLVRKGVLKPEDVSGSLVLQSHLSDFEDVKSIAAGDRQMLGELLVRSGHISADLLDRAIAEQKLTGEKLGDVFIRLGMLTEQQIDLLLEFQRGQETTTQFSPLRLGELLVTSGDISRAQLDDSLAKQSLSHKKLGKILVEEGYINSKGVKKGFRLQKMLVNAALSAILSLSVITPAVASSVSLRWDASIETDLAGYKVYYSVESTPLESSVPIDVNNQTSTTITGLDPAKSYTFAVSAYDTAGLESGFSNVVTLAEQILPTVSIISPADLDSVGGTVPITVDAADNVGVARVEFFVNGVLNGAETEAPYVHLWDTHAVPGTYTLMVKAYDEAGNVSLPSTRTVTVVNDNIAPAVSLTSPTANSVYKGTVTISSSASDNVGVTNVEYYANGQFLYASNLSPYSFSWDTTSIADGDYSIVAKAYDRAGNVTQSSQVSVTVDNSPPTLNSGFNLPVTSRSLTVAVSGLSATDNRGVNGYLLTESAVIPTAGSAGWSATAPTSFTFSSEGTKTLYAWAKDSVGNISASRSATVNIDVTAPALNSFSVPAISTSLTVAVSGLSATDNKGVTGYLLTESAVTPTAGSAGWSTTAPTSFTFSSEGAKILYAWAKDSVGNISASRSATVTVALPGSGTTLSLADALLALQIGAGVATVTPAQAARLDVAPVINGVSVPDGLVGTGDAIVILTKVVGKARY